MRCAQITIRLRVVTMMSRELILAGGEGCLPMKFVTTGRRILRRAANVQRRQTHFKWRTLMLGSVLGEVRPNDSQRNGLFLHHAKLLVPEIRPDWWPGLPADE
jgi:hypothetical protein